MERCSFINRLVSFTTFEAVTIATSAHEPEAVLAVVVKLRCNIVVVVKLRCNRRLDAYSITSSAMASTPGGKVRPRVFAVFKLMTNSNLVGCMTGRSLGFSPLRILPV
jgi:hypothetical protein